MIHWRGPLRNREATEMATVDASTGSFTGGHSNRLATSHLSKPSGGGLLSVISRVQHDCLTQKSEAPEFQAPLKM